MNLPYLHSDQRPGFSLLELMAVVALIGILATITITRIVASTDNAKEKSCSHNRSQLNAALERFALTTDGFATAIGDIDTVEYFPSGIPTCPVDDMAYTLNATTHRIDGHVH